KRKRKDVHKWLLSCIPDICFSVMILLGAVCQWIVRKDIFLWLYLYSIYFLCCKVLLLTIGNVVRIYSLKITVFRWKERKNSTAFLARYFLFYQNAIARNVFLFMFGLLIPLTVLLNDVGWTSETASIMGFLYLGALLPLGLSCMPAKAGLNQFAAWGDSERLKRLFCQEYFAEDHLYHDDNFTVTKHFLIEEQRPATVYYWPCLKSISGWIIDKDNRHKSFFFTDGKECRFTPEEAKLSEQVFRYAQNNLGLNQNFFDKKL
uniref:hypothetical protein n=1 Tax=Acetatifactor sp. TaxID=1872090 RepID=UPI004057B971